MPRRATDTFTSEQRSLLPSDGSTQSAQAQQKHKSKIMMTACYCMGMAINGGMCGAFGPALEYFQRATGLSQVALGTAVLQNRLAKLGGTLMWAWYASLIKADARPGGCTVQPFIVVAACYVVSALACAVLGFTRSGGALQACMLISGFSYGVTDTACNTMCLATWAGVPSRQRGYVALINAMFTIGAFMTPMLVAASLHYLQDVVWPAFHLLSLLAICNAIALACLRNPPSETPSPSLGSHPSTEELEELSSLTSQTDTTDDERGEATPPARAARAVPPLERLANFSDPPGTHSKSSIHEDRTLALDLPPARASPARGGLGFLAGLASRSAAHQQWVLVIATCVVGFFANGCEHSVATWLSPYGVRRCAVSEEAMAIMTSNFWTTMAAGRCAWAMFSTLIPSTWPVLFFNGLCCFCSCLLFNSSSEKLLWVGALGAGVGVSSTFPALITLAAELGIEMTPKMMATLQLTASGGEMAVPFLIGLLFQFRLYTWFAAFNAITQVISLVALTSAWLYLRPRRGTVQPAKSTPLAAGGH